MAFESGTVWAIDIGNNSLKALHLSAASGAVAVIGFDNIQHSKILAGSGIKAAERDEIIALSLREFVKKNDLGNVSVVVSVPSQNSFARFVKLPPVEQKRIPEIVRFEAAQQIPFNISDVQWDWQLMTEPGSAETRVGIFAVKNEVVTAMLDHFSRENITVSYVQMAPMALYNYALYDRSDSIKSDAQATVILDIGAENTDLVVCTKSTVWQRAIPMGGNAFTRAVADAFKLNFEKAEKLKRTATMSKYARQVFQAMRPVFTDLASEIQRSLGFYKTSNPDTKLAKIIALGGGTKMRGLLKYLQQTLQIPIERPDSFEKLVISSGVSAAKFHENVCDFGIVYGLALQGLGLGKIESNLLPRSIARSMIWAGKAKYFTFAACLLLLISVLSLGRALFIDSAKYKRNEGIRRGIANVISAVKQTTSLLEEQKGRASRSEKMIQKEFSYLKYRDVVPLLHQTLMSILPNEKNNPEQSELYRAFAEGDVETVKEISRKEREQIFVTSISVRFVTDIAIADFGAMDFVRWTGGSRRGRPGVGAPDVTGMPFMPGMPGMPFMPGMPGMPGMPPGPGTKSTRRSSRGDRRDDTSKKADKDKGGPGFVITVSGYSPYKNLGELMDPPGVEGEPDKWGVVTRLLHLDDIFDGNSPFELYKRTDIQHFKLEIGEVGWDVEMPVGIGIEEAESEKAKKDEQRLIDPMTKELICKVPELDESGREKLDRSGNIVYKVNDHWFRLDAKFIWKDAPHKVEGEKEEEEEEKEEEKKEE